MSNGMSYNNDTLLCHELINAKYVAASVAQKHFKPASRDQTVDSRDFDSCADDF